MTTAFQRSAFQNNAFQIDAAAGSGDWGGWLVLALMDAERRAKRQRAADAVAEKEVTREQVAQRIAEIRARLRAVPARSSPIITDLGPLAVVAASIRADREALELAEFKALTEAIIVADDWLDAA